MSMSETRPCVRHVTVVLTTTLKCCVLLDVGLSLCRLSEPGEDGCEEGQECKDTGLCSVQQWY